MRQTRMLTIDPRGIGRRGCVVGIDGAGDWACAVVDDADVPGTGAFSWAKTARAASRAASGLLARCGRATEVVDWVAVLERAWSSDWLGGMFIPKI